jgi:hypothetical protein
MLSESLEIPSIMKSIRYSKNIVGHGAIELQDKVLLMNVPQ